MFFLAYKEGYLTTVIKYMCACVRARVCTCAVTCEDLQADLCERGEGRLIQHTHAAHFLHLG